MTGPEVLRAALLLGSVADFAFKLACLIASIALLVYVVDKSWRGRAT